MPSAAQPARPSSLARAGAGHAPAGGLGESGDFKAAVAQAEDEKTSCHLVRIAGSAVLFKDVVVPSACPCCWRLRASPHRRPFAARPRPARELARPAQALHRMHAAGAQRAAQGAAGRREMASARAAALRPAIAWRSPCSRPAATGRRRRSSRRSPATWARIGPGLRAELWAQAGQAFMEAGRGRQGRRGAEPRARRSRAGDPDLWVDRGLSYAAMRAWPRAISDFDRALALRPNDVEILVLRAAAWRNAGNPARALDDAARALKIAPDHSEALLERGFANLARGERSQATNDFNKVLRLVPPGSSAARRAQAGLRGEPPAAPAADQPPAPGRRRSPAVSGSLAPVTDVRATANEPNPLVDRPLIAAAVRDGAALAQHAAARRSRSRHPPIIPRRRPSRRRRSSRARRSAACPRRCRPSAAQGRPYRDRLGRRGPAFRRRAQDRVGTLCQDEGRQARRASR